MGFLCVKVTIFNFVSLVKCYRFDCHFTVCVFGFSGLADKLPDSSSVRVPKIRTIFGVVGILKLLAGNVALFKPVRVQTFTFHLVYLRSAS